MVDRSFDPAHGKIVIAAINGELTVKRLSKTSHGLLLLPDKDTYFAIEIKDSEDLIILGIMTSLHKIFRKGIPYNNCGVLLFDLHDKNYHQSDIFNQPSEKERLKL